MVAVAAGLSTCTDLLPCTAPEKGRGCNDIAAPDSTCCPGLSNGRYCPVALPQDIEEHDYHKAEHMVLCEVHVGANQTRRICCHQVCPNRSDHCSCEAGMGFDDLDLVGGRGRHRLLPA